MIKHFLCCAALAVLTLLCSSCATAPSPPLAAGGFSGGAGGSDIITRGTGFRFPARIGPFIRAGTRLYDAAGQDLSVKYLAGALAVADVYEYPTRGKSLATEFVDRKDEVRFYHSDARLLHEGEVTIHPGGKVRRGRKARFAVSEGYNYSFPPPYQSDLLVFQNGQRFIEYRFTYSAAHRERVQSEIDKFFDALAWPE